MSITLSESKELNASTGTSGFGRPGSSVWKLLTTTDHKMLGLMYIVTCFILFFIGGLMALLVRAELFLPGMQFLSNAQFHQMFTMHGTVMLLFFGTPVVIGFGNYIVPLHIGAPDVAFPRLNALGYWLFAFGAVLLLAGFVTPGGAAAFGWTIHAPLSDSAHSPQVGADLWIMGVSVGGIGTILGAVNLLTTIICMRAPGMVFFRMPIFTWSILVTAVMILFAFPLLTAALMGCSSIAISVATCSTRQTVAPLCGNIFSGSSVVPRSISSRSRSSGWCPRYSLSSRVSRCSVIPD